jgi:ABC-type phosphate transport system substrate-binding protein
MMAWGAAAVVVATLAVTGFSVKNPQRSWAVAPNTLFGEGGSFEMPVITALQTSTGGLAAIAPLAPAYFNANVDQARNDLVSGAADYAVSEMPLTAAQVATAAQNKLSFAYVPFAASGVAISAIVECNNDTVLKPTTLCPNLQLTVPLLAQVLTQTSLTSWSNPAFAHSSGGNPVLATDTSANIHPINQVEPSAVNLGLASLFENDPTDNQAAKQTWGGFLRSRLINDDTPSELWPTGGGVTGGDRAVADSLIPVNEQTNPPIPQPNPQEWGGGDIAGLPTDWLGSPRNLPTIAIQNVAGQYVSPTVAAISAAEKDATVDPSTNLVTFQSNPNDAAAYPIPVMNYLVVPTSGLSAAKATALAAFIRYVLGSGGQGLLSQLGDAPVTPAMASAGLHVADVVAAEATATTTTTSTTVGATTSTTKAGAPGSATPAAVPTGDTSGSSPGSGSSGTSSPAGNSGTGTSATPSAATSSGPTLAYTGGAPWLVAVVGGALLFAGEAARRPLRRRLRQRGSVP